MVFRKRRINPSINNYLSSHNLKLNINPTLDIGKVIIPTISYERVYYEKFLEKSGLHKYLPIHNTRFRSICGAAFNMIMRTLCWCVFLCAGRVTVLLAERFCSLSLYKVPIFQPSASLLGLLAKIKV